MQSAAHSPASTAELPLANWWTRNAHVLIAAAVYAAAVVVALSQEFVQDTWLSIAGGRDILRNGLPWHERLTALTHGAPWVDQQWLGKLTLYGVTGLGGVRLLALVHVALLMAGFAGAIGVARRFGASDYATFWVAAATIPAAPWAWQIRVQSLAYVLFVTTIALLVADARQRSARVWLVLPVLVVWANVHGSVTLGVALTVIAGVVDAARRRKRGIALGMAAVLCLFASPYGFSLAQYYRSLLFNPMMGDYVGEWRPSSAPGALPFFALALAVGMLMARNWRRFTAFEQLALIATGAAGFMAIRGVVWFLLTTVVVVPRAVDAELGDRARPSRLIPTLALASIITAGVLGAVGLERLPARISASFPDAAAEAVRRDATTHPHAKVYASERFADWLLWQEPSLGGRIVYDVRFELFNRARFDQLSAFHARAGAGWKRILDGARIVILDRAADSASAEALASEPRAQILFRDATVVVIDRG